MQDLTRTLDNYDVALLRVIANRWDVDLGTSDKRTAATRLAAAMGTAERVADVWSRLDDDQRRALQTILGSGGKMPGAMFERLFGKIRQMGSDRLEREQPYLHPASLAEALYYRGLIATGLNSGTSGSPQPFTYVPTDLIPLLPTKQTGYDLTAAPAPIEAAPQPEPGHIRLADTALVDDMATFLAFCQAKSVLPTDNGGILTLPAEAQQILKAQFLGLASTARIALLLALSADLNLCALQEGAWRPLPTARQWLESRRADQVRVLAEAWQRSATYNELLYLPGIKVEISAGWPNDPLLARQTLCDSLDDVPPTQWWSVDELIDTIKEIDPDFQRPAGDYDSWYIREAASSSGSSPSSSTATAQYLRGFETWDRIEGAQLRFILVGVMNTLGLVDTAEHGKVCRLTAYGRALIGATAWPIPTGDPPPIVLAVDGTAQVPRAANRYDRVQLARLADWVESGDPFVYRITPTSLSHAAAQHVKPDQVASFLQRATRDAVPTAVIRMVETWAQAGNESATLGRLFVLRTPTPELLHTIQEIPELRRYLSVPLGPTAVAVRADRWSELLIALQSQGIAVDSDLDAEL
jgi:hypothetical protein